MDDTRGKPGSRSTSGTRREPLSRDRVLAAALAIADERGLEALTMRGLARALGVEPMSLYHYAASRDEIVGALVDRVVEQIELPMPDEGWKAAIRSCAISAHRVLRRHPWACNPLMSGPRISPARLRMVDALLATFEAARLPPDLADLAYHAIDSHILGFTLWEAGYTRGMPALTGDDLTAFLERLGIDRYPHLKTHAEWHLGPHDGPRQDEFEFKLDLVLDGVDQMRDRTPTQSDGPAR